MSGSYGGKVSGGRSCGRLAEESGMEGKGREGDWIKRMSYAHYLHFLVGWNFLQPWPSPLPVPPRLSLPTNVLNM